MKKIDTVKYISICFSTVALAFSLLGFQTLSSLLAAAAIFAIILNPHKSGNLFIFTFFFAAISIGFAVDYPFNMFPPALIGFLLIAFIFNFRTFFYRQMLITKIPWLEMALAVSVLVFFIVSAIVIRYDLRQWLTASPIIFFVMFTLMMYKDRKEINKILGNKRIEMKVGIEAPAFALPDQYGNLITLNDLLKNNHVLLIFVRGDWCPTCHIMLRSYFRNKEKFAEKNVRVVGVGPDPKGVNKEIMLSIDESSIMLSDDNQETALLYASDLQNPTAISKNSTEKGIPLPASFLVHQNGKIAHTSRSDKPGEILQPDLIFQVLATFN